eukprot:1297579-Amphidinium_carterae.1
MRLSRWKLCCNGFGSSLADLGRTTSSAWRTSVIVTRMEMQPQGALSETSLQRCASVLTSFNTLTVTLAT